MNFKHNIILNQKRLSLFISGLVFSLSLFLISCHQQKNYIQIRGQVFHTHYNIKYDINKDYRQGIDSVFNAFSLSLNPFEAKSLISAINRNETNKVDKDFIKVWQMVERIAKASDGRYDPTASPLINAWGFGFEQEQANLSQKEIDSLLSFVGYEKVHLQGDSLIKDDERTIFDLSSISKGYCSDLLGLFLEQEGSQNYLVEIGGEIAFKGKNERGEAWQIGINKPIEDSTGKVNEIALILSLDRPKGGLATSGNYRNFKLKNGKKIAHTLNSKTGYPTQTDVLSATILAPSCMQADGLATACMTLSSAEVPKMLKRFPEVEYLLIISDKNGNFKTIMSDGLKDLIVQP